MPPEDDLVADAAAALSKAYATGDKKMVEDVEHAFDRNCDIEKARKDTGRK